MVPTGRELFCRLRRVKGKQVRNLCELVTVNTECCCRMYMTTGVTREGRLQRVDV